VRWKMRNTQQRRPRAGRRIGQADPVIGKFLRFLEKDMAAHPARVRAIPSTLLARGAALVKGVEVDLDAALPDDDA